MKKKPDINDWLISKGATPVERKLYKLAVKLHDKKQAPLMNADLRRVHKSHRTNITQHLTHMIGKGLIKRHSRDWFIPVDAAQASSR